jgi:hypothetical protein
MSPSGSTLLGAPFLLFPAIVNVLDSILHYSL